MVKLRKTLKIEFSYTALGSSPSTVPSCVVSTSLQPNNFSVKMLYIHRYIEKLLARLGYELKSHNI